VKRALKECATDVIFAFCGIRNPNQILMSIRFGKLKLCYIHRAEKNDIDLCPRKLLHSAIMTSLTSNRPVIARRRMHPPKLNQDQRRYSYITIKRRNVQTQGSDPCFADLIWRYNSDPMHNIKTEICRCSVAFLVVYIVVVCRENVSDGIQLC
jgi:hypothetical protein